jgi:hypothetical protein
MMDELINEVSAKTGLSSDQARAAVTSVLAFLKERLPSPLASGLDSLLAGGGAGAQGGQESMVSEAESLLGGLFSKKDQ